MKITLDPGKCIGCGSCASICPKAFEMGADKAEVKTPEVSEVTCEKEAESACPTQAISIS